MWVMLKQHWRTPENASVTPHAIESRMGLAYALRSFWLGMLPSRVGDPGYEKRHFRVKDALELVGPVGQVVVKHEKAAAEHFAGVLSVNGDDGVDVRRNRTATAKYVCGEVITPKSSASKKVRYRLNLRPAGQVDWVCRGGNHFLWIRRRRPFDIECLCGREQFQQFRQRSDFRCVVRPV